MSFGEMIVLSVVALVVVGPRNLPSLMRTLGGTIGRLRRLAVQMRNESGIDEILDAEGIKNEIQTFKKLASGEILEEDLEPKIGPLPEREREYPSTGCDSYGALSEDLAPYAPTEVGLPVASGPVPRDEPSAHPSQPPSPAGDVVAAEMKGE